MQCLGARYELTFGLWLERTEEMRATLAREREMLAHQRATQLTRANEAIRGCLDTLVSVPELDESLGQVMAPITSRLGAVSSNGSGISSDRLEKSDGCGLESMRETAQQIDAKLEIQTAEGRGTSIMVTVPISS
jgi:two-component sensor histidine kinase